MKLKDTLNNYHKSITHNLDLPDNWELIKLKSDGKLKFRVAPFGNTEDYCFIELDPHENNPRTRAMFSINSPIEKENFRMECLRVLRKVETNYKTIASAMHAKSLANKL